MLAQQNIFRLDVTMLHAFAMNVVDRVDELQEAMHAFCMRELGPAQSVLQ